MDPKESHSGQLTATSFEIHVFWDRDNHPRASFSKDPDSKTSPAIYLEPDDVRRLFRLKILAHLTDKGVLTNVKPTE